MSKEHKHKVTKTEEFFDYRDKKLSGKEANAFERRLEKDPFEAEAAEGFELLSREEALNSLSKLEKKIKNKSGRSRRMFAYSIAAGFAVILTVGTLFIRLYDVDTKGKTLEDVSEVAIESAEPDESVETVESVEPDESVESGMSVESGESDMSVESVESDMSSKSSVSREDKGIVAAKVKETDQKEIKIDDAIMEDFDMEEIVIEQVVIEDELVDELILIEAAMGEAAMDKAAMGEEAMGEEVIEEAIEEVVEEDAAVYYFEIADEEEMDISEQVIRTDEQIPSTASAKRSEMRKASSRRKMAVPVSQDFDLKENDMSADEVLQGKLTGVEMMDENVVRGKVIAADDQAPLPGVSVVIRGTTVGTVTDFDGNFSLELNDDEAQVADLHFIGMESAEIDLNKKDLTVVMQESEQSLDEVVVVGYGVSKKHELTTGSQQTIDPSGPENSYQGAYPEMGMRNYKKYVDSVMVFPPVGMEIQRAVVVIKFIVSSNGRPNEASVIKSPSEAFSKEALRILNVGPDWVPASNNGEYSASEVRLRIVFKQ